MDLVCQIGSTRSIAVALAAHRPRGPLARRGSERALFRDHARRPGRMRGARPSDPPRRSRRASAFPERRSIFWRSKSWPCARPRIGARTSCSRAVRRAYPYRNLSRTDFDEIVEMLSEGIAARRGRYGAYLHRDRVNGMVCAGAAAPARGDHKRRRDSGERALQRRRDAGRHRGRHGGRGLRRGKPRGRHYAARKHFLAHPARGIGRVLVEDAHGAPPNIPFWRGEAPARTRRAFAARRRVARKITTSERRLTSQEGCCRCAASAGTTAEKPPT